MQTATNRVARSATGGVKGNPSHFGEQIVDASAGVEA